MYVCMYVCRFVWGGRAWTIVCWQVGFLALLPSCMTCASRSPPFRLYSPKICKNSACSAGYSGTSKLDTCYEKLVVPLLRITVLPFVDQDQYFDNNHICKILFPLMYSFGEIPIEDYCPAKYSCSIFVKLSSWNSSWSSCYCFRASNIDTEMLSVNEIQKLIPIDMRTDDILVSKIHWGWGTPI